MEREMDSKIERQIEGERDTRESDRCREVSQTGVGR